MQEPSQLGQLAAWRICEGTIGPGDATHSNFEFRIYRTSETAVFVVTMTVMLETDFFSEVVLAMT